LGLLQEKYLILEDTVSFLVATSDEGVGNELKGDFGRITRKWKDLLDVSRDLNL